MPYPVAAVRNKNFGSPQYSGLILSLGPIAYWPLNDASGSAAVNQVSAALNGAYTACTLAQSQPPFTAPLWDGATSYCNIYSAGLNTAWNRDETSFALWVKPSGAGVWTDGVLRFALYLATTPGSTDALYFYKNSANNQAILGFRIGGTTEQVTLSGQSWTSWTHIAVTGSKTADQMKAFVNGAQVGATQTTLGVKTANALGSTLCCVGSGTTAPANVWSGWLAHAAIWNRPLTPTEVANLYAWGVG